MDCSHKAGLMRGTCGMRRSGKEWLIPVNAREISARLSWLPRLSPGLFLFKNAYHGRRLAEGSLMTLEFVDEQNTMSICSVLLVGSTSSIAVFGVPDWHHQLL